MSTAPHVQEPTGQPALSQIERVVDTYIAPSKTFMDIRRSTSWWLPWVISVIVSLMFTFAVQSKIGWDKVTAQQIAQSPKRAAQMEQLPKDQQDKQIAFAATFTRYISYSVPVIGLIVIAIIAGVLMLSVNFGLGARTGYMSYWAIWVYCGLPLQLKYVLATVLIFAGVGRDNFDIQNPIATNAAGFLGPGGSAVLKPILSTLDVFNIWTAVLLILGISIVCKVSRGAAAAVVIGWWALITLFGVAGAVIAS